MSKRLKKPIPVLYSSCAMLFIGFFALENGRSQAQEIQTEKAVPRFTIENMDRTVDPGVDFYRYATGTWLKNNPVPPDKARWGGLDELQQRNWQLIHDILETSAANHSEPPHSPTREVGDFFASVMDTNRLEELSFKPLKPAFDRIAALNSTEEMLRLMATFQEAGLSAMFSTLIDNDAKNSAVYAFYLRQGGLGLPDRDYYLTDAFAKQRDAYISHITRMLTLVGERKTEAKAHANTILDLETALAKASKSRAGLRDPISNYHKFEVAGLPSKYPSFPLHAFLEASGLAGLSELIVEQPEFFAALNELVKDRPLDDWKTYLRWHVLRSAAPYLHSAAENEAFAFYGTLLSGQQAQEPRWQRAAKTIDSHIGEALGELYVQKYFPPVARVQVNELVENLKAVFRDRLKTVDWITDATRDMALNKFERFTQMIGYPDKFRDYSSVKIRSDDLFGNIQRATIFESKRQRARVGRSVDRTEWWMTPQNGTGYFDPVQNEIVYAAGFLQPPFFDVTLDDAVNYGAIGVSIGHEITHGYDDAGRKYDADGNLHNWWAEADAKAFEARAQKLVDQYGSYEALPGLKVNGRLTLGENIADLGGTSIAYEALERALAKDPSKRHNIDGFTPEQRFFLSFTQILRTNWREEELRHQITVDPHSPGQFRAIGPLVNLQSFYDAFNIKEGAPIWRSPELRAKIW
jgi:putative endopeptidase